MINLDFNDVKTVITEGGDAIIGVGAHRGENRALEAAKKAIKSPLIEDISIAGARGALINISAGSNLTLYEANEAASVIQEAAGNEANIIFGTVIDESMVDEMRVTVIATGFHLNKKGEIDAAPETTQVVGRRAARSVTASAPAVTVQSGADDDLGGDLDYPAILRKQQA
jgi:cell division protein FtsZ